MEVDGDAAPRCSPAAGAAPQSKISSAASSPFPSSVSFPSSDSILEEEEEGVLHQEELTAREAEPAILEPQDVTSSSGTPPPAAWPSTAATSSLSHMLQLLVPDPQTLMALSSAWLAASRVEDFMEDARETSSPPCKRRAEEAASDCPADEWSSVTAKELQGSSGSGISPSPPCSSHLLQPPPPLSFTAATTNAAAPHCGMGLHDLFQAISREANCMDSTEAAKEQASPLYLGVMAPLLKLYTKHHLHRLRHSTPTPSATVKEEGEDVPRYDSGGRTNRKRDRDVEELVIGFQEALTSASPIDRQRALGEYPSQLLYRAQALGQLSLLGRDATASASGVSEPLCCVMRSKGLIFLLQQAVREVARMVRKVCLRSEERKAPPTTIAAVVQHGVRHVVHRCWEALQLMLWIGELRPWTRDETQERKRVWDDDEVIREEKSDHTAVKWVMQLLLHMEPLRCQQLRLAAADAGGTALVNEEEEEMREGLGNALVSAAVLNAGMGEVSWILARFLFVHLRLQLSAPKAAPSPSLERWVQFGMAGFLSLMEERLHRYTSYRQLSLPLTAVTAGCCSIPAGSRTQSSASRPGLAVPTRGKRIFPHGDTASLSQPLRAVAERAVEVTRQLHSCSSFTTSTSLLCSSFLYSCSPLSWSSVLSVHNQMIRRPQLFMGVELVAATTAAATKGEEVKDGSSPQSVLSDIIRVQWLLTALGSSSEGGTDNTEYGGSSGASGGGGGVAGGSSNGSSRSREAALSSSLSSALLSVSSRRQLRLHHTAAIVWHQDMQLGLLSLPMWLRPPGAWGHESPLSAHQCFLSEWFYKVYHPSCFKVLPPSQPLLSATLLRSLQQLHSLITHGPTAEEREKSGHDDAAAAAREAGRAILAKDPHILFLTLHSMLLAGDRTQHLASAGVPMERLYRVASQFLVALYGSSSGSGIGGSSFTIAYLTSLYRRCGLLHLPWSVSGTLLALARYHSLGVNELVQCDNEGDTTVLTRAEQTLILRTVHEMEAQCIGRPLSPEEEQQEEALAQAAGATSSPQTADGFSTAVQEAMLRHLAPPTLLPPLPCGLMLVVGFYHNISRTILERYAAASAAAAASAEGHEELSSSDDDKDTMAGSSVSSSFCSLEDVEIASLHIRILHRLVFAFQPACVMPLLGSARQHLLHPRVPSFSLFDWWLGALDHLCQVISPPEPTVVWRLHHHHRQRRGGGGLDFSAPHLWRSVADWNGAAERQNAVILLRVRIGESLADLILASLEESSAAPHSPSPQPPPPPAASLLRLCAAPLPDVWKRLLPMRTLSGFSANRLTWFSVSPSDERDGCGAPPPVLHTILLNEEEEEEVAEDGDDAIGSPSIGTSYPQQLPVLLLAKVTASLLGSEDERGESQAEDSDGKKASATPPLSLCWLGPRGLLAMLHRLDDAITPGSLTSKEQDGNTEKEGVRLLRRLCQRADEYVKVFSISSTSSSHSL